MEEFGCSVTPTWLCCESRLEDAHTRDGWEGQEGQKIGEVDYEMLEVCTTSHWRQTARMGLSTHQRNIQGRRREAQGQEREGLGEVETEGCCRDSTEQAKSGARRRWEETGRQSSDLNSL